MTGPIPLADLRREHHATARWVSRAAAGATPHSHELAAFAWPLSASGLNNAPVHNNQDPVEIPQRRQEMSHGHLRSILLTSSMAFWILTLDSVSRADVSGAGRSCRPPGQDESASPSTCVIIAFSPPKHNPARAAQSFSEQQSGTCGDSGARDEQLIRENIRRPDTKYYSVTAITNNC